MVQLKILTGKQAGATWAARRFPVRIGRSRQSSLCSDEDGVWDNHARLELDPDRGVVLKAQPGALARLGGEPVEEAVLRNGDQIELGSLRLQFWLSEAPQRSLALREWLTWAGIAAVSLGQIAVVYWLLIESR